MRKKFKDVLTVPGVELSIGKGRGGSSYHVVVLGLEEVSKPEVSNINELNSFLAVTLRSLKAFQWFTGTSYSH